MYGKAYQAENILRKKKKRPFAKEIIKEVNDCEDLFNVLFCENIKDVKHKVKQYNPQRSSYRKTKIGHRPGFAGIPEQSEGESVSSDPFDALLKDTRGHIEKNKINVCDSQIKPGAKIHEDEKENLPEEKNALVFEDKKKSVFFESVFRGREKTIAEKPDPTTFKRKPLKLKSDRSGSLASGNVIEKLNPDQTTTYLNFLDSSCNSDALEDEFKAKREELRKKKEEHNAITQSTISLHSASGLEDGKVGVPQDGEDTCSGNDSHSVCSHLLSLRNSENFVSSTPVKHDSMMKQHRVNQTKHEQKRECCGSEVGHKLNTPEELPCFLSPILSMTQQGHHKCNLGQKNENISSFGPLRLSSKKNENQMNMKYWKEMYEELNPVTEIEKITVVPFIHSNHEDSGTDESLAEAVKNFTDKKENICSLQQRQSPDPFADSDVLHEHFQTSSADGLVKSETPLEDHKQPNSTCEHVSKYCHSVNEVTQDLSDRENSSSYSIIEQTNQPKNNSICKYMSRIEEDYMSGIDSQNSPKENGANIQDSFVLPKYPLYTSNIVIRRSYRSRHANCDEKKNTPCVVGDSKQSMISEIGYSRMSSSCSGIYSKLDTSEKIPESIDFSSQNGSLSDKMSQLSLSESRSRIMKKKSFHQRRSHLVVPLAPSLAQGFGRILGFREVYISTPSQRRYMDKISSQWQAIERKDSILKYDDDDEVLDKEEKAGVTFKDVVLEHCGQTGVLAFDEAFSESDLAECKKIGEGVYGEVFARVNSQQQPIVMKIMPIEGDCQINGEPQKSFEEILPEIVISAQMSRLRDNENFSTPNFPELIDCWCVQGKYPPKLLKLWQEYDEDKTSENDSPQILPEDQIYLILELSNVGSALESFTFNSAEQSWSAFMQVAYTLAVAEACLEFEHRDLHWGNILIKRTTDKTITCKMYGEDHIVPTQGIQASVIDFTLSRITYDGCCIFNNLAEDPALFEGEGDYQFDIYRMMRDKTENNWQVFEPYNNVLWLSYVLEKLITETYYRNEKTKIHKRGSGKLKEMRSRILDFKSATEVVLSFS